MPNGTENEIRLPSLDDLFSSQKERNEAKQKRIEDIPLSEIDPFPNHPFKVKDDEDMDNLVESIRAQGIITPAAVRRKKDGRYELVSGHRRKRACEILGMTTLRCEVLDLSKDEATIFMVESNFQRTTILPSEKAFAYKMRLEAIKSQIGRMKDNQKRGMNYGGEPVEPQLRQAQDHLMRAYGMTEEEVQAVGSPESRRKDAADPLGPRYRTNAMLAKEVNESTSQIKRYIRLTELIPQLLELVDEGKIAIRPAVELSYLEHRQIDVYNCIEMEQCTPTHAQAIRMRKLYQEGKLTKEAVMDIMLEEKPNQKEKLTIRGDRVTKLFPKNLPVTKREEYIVAAMEHYGRYLARKERDNER